MTETKQKEIIYYGGTAIALFLVGISVALVSFEYILKDIMFPIGQLLLIIAILFWGWSGTYLNKLKFVLGKKHD